MSEIIGTPWVETVHEAYAFACMRCGHGWEQAYEIHHHTNEAGRITVTYHVAGIRVPSPLTQPSCQNCGGHVVRIMRPGRVAGARWDRFGPPVPRQDTQEDQQRHLRYGTYGDRGQDVPAAGPLPGSSGPAPHHHAHWRLADLLHLLGLHGRQHGEHDAGKAGNTDDRVA